VSWERSSSDRVGGRKERNRRASISLLSNGSDASPETRVFFHFCVHQQSTLQRSYANVQTEKEHERSRRARLRWIRVVVVFEAGGRPAAAVFCSTSHLAVEFCARV
jgi:hypothetical protein